MTTVLNKKVRDYKDFSFIFETHPETNNLLVKTNAASVRQSVINLLTLHKSDKPFHPEISSPVYGFLFENIGLLEKVVIESSVKKYLGNYEPRLSVSQVIFELTDTNSMSLTVKGSIINLLEPFTVNVLISRIR